MSHPLRRRALLVDTSRYRDERFAPLPSARADTWQLRQVLEHRYVGGFASVRVVSDLGAHDLRLEIAEFLENRGEDELALLYFSGHGVRLTATTGEFFFVASDTDYDQVPHTAVSAGFLNELLEACPAPQKVAMLDCCLSGGFTLGFRTDDGAPRTAKSASVAPLKSRGVYVLASSGAREYSYSGADGPEGPKPSLFTGEVIEALRTGRAGAGDSGLVSVDDLFEYVNRRMRKEGEQIPQKSSLAVNDRIVIASRPQATTVPVLTPLTRRTLSDSTATAPGAGELHGAKSSPGWRELIDYYRECVLADEADTPLMSVDDHGGSYVCLSGEEHFLSGELDEHGFTPVPAEAADFIDETLGQEAELWAGYPAVVLTGPRGGSPWRRPRFAPLLVRRVEIVDDGSTVQLQPYGPVLPHPRLASAWLGSEEASELITTYQPTWHAGQHERMAADARNLLLTDFELPCVQELHPDDLRDSIDVRSPGHGARNVAILFRAPKDKGASRGLVKDLAYIAQKITKIRETALAELLDADPEHDPAEPCPVTPLAANDRQLDVLRSAMTRRLTVATGPPGTGKSQLVANVVATATTKGEKVLVASTNNQAVDEVWERCERLIPGSVVRTGSSSGEKDYRQQELSTLQQLLGAPRATSGMATATAELTTQRRKLAGVRQIAAGAARVERELRDAGAKRERCAGALGQSVSDLSAGMGTDRDPSDWERRAQRAERARLLGRWRRARLLRKLGVDSDPTAEVCAHVAGFAAAEGRWRNGRHEADIVPTDAELADSLSTATEALQRAAVNAWQTAHLAGVGSGRRAILGLIQGQGSDWPALRSVLSHVRGWATTSLSARRFPTDPALFDLVIIDEASQCAIPQVVPLLFRARRALVIGDVMQLKHITGIAPEREAAIRRDLNLPSSWLERHQLAYRRHSAFHAAERAANESFLLDEHYRCHPDIAAVSNRLFYGDQLNVLTDVRGRPKVDRPALTWVDVAGQAIRPVSGGSWLNREEAETVRRCVDYLLNHLPPDSTVGVVTPFTAQKEWLSRLWPDEERVRVGTVHTFQGGERDAMVFSLVAGEGMSSGAIGWVDQQINLWNVAITRARSHLITVGDAKLWRRRGGTGAELLRSAEALAGADQWSSREPNELAQRFYEMLADVPGVAVELGARVHGYPTDALVRNGDATPVLLDRGATDAASEERHIRLMLRRRELLDAPAGGPAAVRLPAWKLYDQPAVLAALELDQSGHNRSIH